MEISENNESKNENTICIRYNHRNTDNDFQKSDSARAWQVKYLRDKQLQGICLR